MSAICLKLSGAKKSQVNELLDDLNSIQHVSAKHLETKIEFKEVCVPIIIEISGAIVIGVFEFVPFTNIELKPLTLQRSNLMDEYRIIDENSLGNLIVLCGVCHKKIHMKVR